MEHLRPALSDLTGPVMVIDRDALDHNIAQVKADVPGGMGVRIVAKSLPCLSLLQRVMDRLGTDRLMTFNLPMVLGLARDMPNAHQLLGKPLIEAAFREALAQGPLPKVTWLVDTIGRLQAYDQIAAAAGQVVDVALEIDVGLHRGGLRDLRPALEVLRGCKHLRYAGLMGYDPHVPSLPGVLGWQRRERAAVVSRYEQAKAAAADLFGSPGEVLNGAGSPTFRMYGDQSVVNEVSLGSVLVKPMDFDTPLLKAYRPAAFIATPVLKGPEPLSWPGFDRVMRGVRFGREVVFIHGGHWLAEPVDPPGLRYSGIFGRSSNQEALVGRGTGAVNTVLLRPTQSEAVMLQFGDLVVVSDGEVIEHWPVFPVSA